MNLSETEKEVLKALINYYDTMNMIENSNDTPNEKEGKKVTKLIMTCNDIEEIYKPKTTTK